MIQDLPDQIHQFFQHHRVEISFLSTRRKGNVYKVRHYQIDLSGKIAVAKRRGAEPGDIVYFSQKESNVAKNGALGLLKKCKPKFEIFEPNCRGIDVLNILNCIDESLKCLNEIDEMKMFDWELVPKIEIDGTRTI